VALLAAACGGSSSGGSKASGGATKSPIHIGYTVALTGTDALFPDGFAGAKAAVRGINARGGINGHPVVLDSCDVQSNVNVAESCTRKLIADGVVAFVSNQDNYGGQQTALEQSAGIADISNDTIAVSSQYNSPVEFPRSSGSNGLFAAGAYYGINITKKTSFAFVGLQIPIVASLAASTKKTVLQHGGTWKGTVSMPATTTAFAPYVAAAAAKHADLTFLAMSGQQAAEFALAAEAAGDSFPTMATAVAFPTSVIKTLGPNTPFGKNMLFSADLPAWTATAQYPVLNTYNSDIKAEAASGDKYAGPNYYSIAMENAWYGVHMFQVIASKISGTIDAKSVLAQLKSTSNLSPGLQPPWSPNVAGPKGFDRIAPSDWNEYMLKIVNGQFALADPKPFNVESYVVG
jgi:branched-chain amino acid transport system substrate-binding protein